MSRVSRLMLSIVFASIPLLAADQIPEPNVNMVSGQQWPGGDAFLRQQNEGSVAVSTRNAMHLLAGANDYRSVDIAFTAAARPDDEQTGDAWLGVFKSFDGGNRWTSTLLDGYPQQNNLNSPLNGFQAAADPVVRAANNGLFYYAGIVLNRGNNPLSAVFMARFIDRNNTESGDPIAFLGTTVIDKGSSGQFIDKPWVAVSPFPNGAQCTVDGQTFAAQNVYLGYSILVGNINNIRTKIMFTRSTDCGNTWATPQKLSETFSINQGVNVAIDPSNSNNVYVVWRRFAGGSDPDSVIVAKSTNAGGSFTKGLVVPNIAQPFDQKTTGAEIRTNAYPTIAVDNTGRVYVAFAQRNAMGDGQIFLTNSADGFTNWSVPAPLAPISGGTSFGRGHQFMPAMTFSAGKLTLAWYDLRDDSTVGKFTAHFDAATKSYTYTASRLLAGNLFIGQPQIVFWNALSDTSPDVSIPLLRRHTIEVYATESTSLGATPTFAPAVRVTRYRSGSLPPAYNTIQDLEIDPPNLPMFGGGTVPFFGDYIDLAAYVNAGANVGGNARIRHVVWTDNRDVRVPPGSPPDWTKYVPVQVPGIGGNTSIFDPNQSRADCTVTNGIYAGTRNQNIYTTRLTDGLFVGSPSNAKPLGSVPHGFTIFMQNTTNFTSLYHLSLSPQPLPAGTASFEQFKITPTLDVNVPAHSTATRMVFVNAPAHTRVDVIVNQDGTSLTSVIALNADPTNPDNASIANAEVFNPEVANPEVANPEVANPEVANPEVANPEVANPEVANPEVANPEVANPEVANPEVANPEVANPEVANTDIANSSMTDTNWNAKNDGTTTGGYTVKLFKLQDLPAGVSARLILNKFYDTPLARGCTLGVQHNRQVVASIKDPIFISDTSALSDASLTDPSATNATLWLAPGETGRITLRLMNPTPGLPLDASGFVTPVVISQSVNTVDAGGENPKPPISLTILTRALPDAFVRQQYNAPLSALGGRDPKTWSVTGLPSGLTVNGSSITGVPLLSGTYAVTIKVTDSSTPAQTQSRNLSLVVHGEQTFIVTNTNDAGAGSLRQAILDSNTNKGYTDTILFAIPGAAPHVITPASALPTISDPVIIDAPPTGACNGSVPTIEIDGVNAGASPGLNIAADGTIVRGLAITRFGSDGIRISASTSSIECSYVGLSTDGVTAKGNAGNGIFVIGSSKNTIGGDSTKRNVISGNGGEGVRIDDDTVGNIVQANYVGTDASGANAVGNTNSGVYLRRSSHTTVSGNVISGNKGFAGVAICGNTTFCGGALGAGGTASANVVTGNLIGTDAAQTATLPNLGRGVSIDGSPNNTIGGSAAAQNVIAASGLSGIHLFGPSPDNNVISFNNIGSSPIPNVIFGNTGDGVLVQTGSNNTITSNLIFNNGGTGISLSATAGNGNLLRGNNIDFNGGIGIDLGDDGPTANDPGDGDTGPNGLQNFPQVNTVIESLATNPFTVHVDGSLQSTPNTQFVVDFFWVGTCHASGFGPGQFQIATTTQTTDANGNLNYSLNFNANFNGGFVTALATAPDNSTSEFSPCAPIQLSQPLVITTEALPDAFPADPKNGPYNFTLTSFGGVPPIQWSINVGSLPAGLGLDGATISGSPTEVTYNTIVVRAMDAVGAKADKVFNIQSWAPRSAYCVAGTFPLFNNTNIFGVQTTPNGANSPVIVAAGRQNGYTLKSIATYHTFAAYLLQPTLGLNGPNTVGPFGVTLVPATQGFQNFQVDQVPAGNVLNGAYTVLDGDTTTWAFNAQSGNTGFTQVCVTPNP